jgi:hypothetical protein
VGYSICTIRTYTRECGENYLEEKGSHTVLQYASKPGRHPTVEDLPECLRRERCALAHVLASLHQLLQEVIPRVVAQPTQRVHRVRHRLPYGGITDPVRSIKEIPKNYLHVRII